MNDNNIRDFFHSNRPSTADEGAYLAGLKFKLDSVEELKRIHDIEISRCKRRTIVISVFSIALGAALMAFISLQPVSVLHLDTPLIAPVLSFIAHWEAYIIAGIAILFICYYVNEKVILFK